MEGEAHASVHAGGGELCMGSKESQRVLSHAQWYHHRGCSGKLSSTVSSTCSTPIRSVPLSFGSSLKAPRDIYKPQVPGPTSRHSASIVLRLDWESRDLKITCVSLKRHSLCPPPRVCFWVVILPLCCMTRTHTSPAKSGQQL